MFGNILLLLILAANIAVLIQQRKIIMNLADAIQVLSDENIKLDDIGTKLTDTAAKLTEGFTEITALIGGLQNTELTPEQEAIVTQVQSKIDGLQTQATSVETQGQQIADIVPGP
jgi:uncharacterized phage infection (PIP) family protein YhgE